MKARLSRLRLARTAVAGLPGDFVDVWGAAGHPIRATVSDMGPLLMARLLNLNETQQGVLSLVYKVADDTGLLLLDLKDLRALLQFTGANATRFRTQYGNVSAASIGAIQRGLLQIETEGGDRFFGEPMLDIHDLIQTIDGHGVVNILAADRLMNSPRGTASFLLWLLSELFEQLPEVGDIDKPKLVFFFDEAHLLFNGAPTRCLRKSSRWYAWCGPRAWEFISSRKIRSIFPTRSSPSLAIACSTPCVPLRRATRRQSGRRPRRCAPIRGLIRRRPLRNWVSERRWCPSWTRRVRPQSPSAPSWFRRPRRSARLPRRHGAA